MLFSLQQKVPSYPVEWISATSAVGVDRDESFCRLIQFSNYFLVLFGYSCPFTELEFISREHFIRIFIPVLYLHWYANGGCGEWSAFYLVHYFNRSLLLLLILWIHFSSTRFTTASTLIHYISRSERILPTMLWPDTMIHPKWLNGRQSNHDMSHCCPHSTLQTTTTMWGRVCAMWELMPVTILNHITSHHRHYPNGIPVSL